MQPAPVIEALDVIEDHAACLRAGVQGEVVEPFGLEQMEEALDRRIVVAIARAAHAADDAVAVEEVLVLGARIGTAAIAVMHEAGSRAARAHRGSERFHGDRLYGTGRGGPPD